MIMDELRYWLMDSDGAIRGPVGLMEWATFHEDIGKRRVAEDTLDDGRWVSTVFLGTDHRFYGDGPPILFETMVFPPKGDGLNSFDDQYCERYCTHAQAKAGHERIVTALRAGAEYADLAA